MKSENLKILKENGINVPKFIIIKKDEDLDLSVFSDDIKYAVRSSFSGEDSSDNSFAGQFETMLNVEKKDLENALKRVKESFHNKNVSDYSAAKNINNDCSGDIIIQEMVDADLSGVMFTSNPLGILNETVIVVGKGLGNNVVEDKINTTSYFYNQDDNIYYYERIENSPILQESVFRSLIDNSEKIKNIFKYAADIEFAIKNDVVYILQTRPITTLQKKTPIILDNSNIVESYPGVSLPLTQDFVKSIYHDIFYNCVLRITKDKKLVNGIDENLKNMTDVFNWRIYYRISNWYAVLKLLPFSNKIISIWQDMLGVKNKEISLPDIEVRLKTKFQVIRSFFYYIKKSPAYMNKLNSDFDRLYKEYKDMVERETTIEGLLNVYYQIKSGILSDWDLTLVNDMYTFIYTFLAGKKNQELISDLKNLESMKPILGIKQLINIAKKDGINSSIYKQEAKKYIDEFGDRCLNELKLETQTYRTNPELLDEYIKRQINTEFNPTEKEEKNTSNIFVKRAKIGIKNRETSRMNRSRLFGVARNIFRKIGAILVESNQIECVDDVFYLHINELTNDCDMKELVQKRKEQFKMYEKMPAYSRIVFNEKIFNKTSKNFTTNVLSDGRLEGTVISTGKIRGEVIVIDVPNDRIDTTGKIIVTKSTDPGWVFIIQNAAGIIAEKGSLLSHTAIISRELHKPAVVNVKDCTKILKNKDIVELDADNGIITIIR